MIAYLKGRPVINQESLMIIVRDEIGYAVSVTALTLAKIQHQPEVELFIHTHVREDALDLYGFNTWQEKEMFLLLVGISGIGPKTALHLLDIGTEKIVTAVQQADVTAFANVPRIGKKVAQKIIIELKPKLGSIQELNLGPKSQQERDIAEALEALGFSDTQIQKAFSQLEINEQTETSMLIKQAIKLATA